MLEDLTIITITYNSDDEFKETFKSIKSLLDNKISWIIIDGGMTISNNDLPSNSVLVSENDSGIYDALNKGISLVQTKYFMLLHAGDTLIVNNQIINDIISGMKYNNYDISLSNLFIGKRKHTINLWNPFFFKFGSQPPHPSIIYRHAFVNKISYDINNKIISDFLYLESVFQKNPKWVKNNIYLIRMNSGGLSTSGIKSFINVSKEFIRNMGYFKGLFVSIARVPFKFLQML